MKRHRRTIGHRAVLISGIVAREKRRRRREQVESHQANRREANRVRGDAPFTPQSRCARLDDRGALQMRGQYVGIHSAATEEKSTPASSATGATSARKVQTRSTIVRSRTYATATY